MVKGCVSMGKLSVVLQLYTVRDFAEKDVKGTLKQVKEMGYDTVELAGMYGMEAAGFKALLDEAGLRALSAHVSLGEFESGIDACVKRYKEVGCDYIAIPWMPPDLFSDAAELDKVLGKIKEIGGICKDNGVTLLYHNHDFEFKKMADGMYGLDYLYRQIPADILQTQVDTCWVKFAGENPAAYILKYAGRCPVVHLKDFIVEGDGGTPYELIDGAGAGDRPKGKFEFRPVGHGCQNFPEIIKAAEEGGCAWIVVEQDMSVGRTSLEAAKMGREYLKSLGY
jgi:sugar phosphate isomerase/epimerase